MVPEKNLGIQEMIHILTRMGFLPHDRAPNEHEGQLF